MTIQHDLLDIRARLHTFNTRHNTHGLLLPDSLIEESIHLIYTIDNIARHHKADTHQINQYLQSWRPIFFNKTPPVNDKSYANAFVLSQKPLMLHEYDAHGQATPLTTTTNSPFLKSWLKHLKGTPSPSMVNHAIYQIKAEGLHDFHTFIRSHKKHQGSFLLRGSQVSESPLPNTSPLYEALPPEEYTCLGHKAVATIIDHSLRILASAPYLDSQHFIHYFLGALSLSLKTHYQAHGLCVENDQICTSLLAISMGGMALSATELDHYERLVLSKTHAAHLTTQYIEQYPPACLKATAQLDNHLHREAGDDDLICGIKLQERYRRSSPKKKNSDPPNPEVKKVREIANRIDCISLAIGHTVEWRLHRQWQYINQEITRAAAERSLWQKLFGLKSIRQRCLIGLKEQLELVQPAVLQEKTKVTADLKVIENSDQSGSTERSSFESNNSKSEKPATAHQHTLHTRHHKAIKKQDHHSNSFNHYFQPSFFHNHEKIYCEPAELEDNAINRPKTSH